MRFHPAKSAATAGAIVAILAATACSSTSSSSSSSSPSGSSATTSPAAAGGACATTSTAATIKANWAKFFAASTPTSERVSLLQNGSTFSQAISSFAGSSLAKGVSSTVSCVTLTSATVASVKYNLVALGQTVSNNATGSAVLEGGVWKVGDGSFCGLLREAGSFVNIKVPAACNSAS